MLYHAFSFFARHSTMVVLSAAPFWLRCRPRVPLSTCSPRARPARHGAPRSAQQGPPAQVTTQVTSPHGGAGKGGGTQQRGNGASARSVQVGTLAAVNRWPSCIRVRPRGGHLRPRRLRQQTRRLHPLQQRAGGRVWAPFDGDCQEQDGYWLITSTGKPLRFRAGCGSDQVLQGRPGSSPP